MPRKYTIPKFARESERLLARLSREATPFAEDDKAKSKRLKACEGDLLEFAKTYLPHYCQCDFAPMHREWADLCKSSGNRAIAAPREFAKSSLLTLARALQAGLFRRRKFLIFISDT